MPAGHCTGVSECVRACTEHPALCVCAGVDFMQVSAKSEGVQRVMLCCDVLMCYPPWRCAVLQAGGPTPRHAVCGGAGVERHMQLQLLVQNDPTRDAVCHSRVVWAERSRP